MKKILATALVLVPVAAGCGSSNKGADGPQASVTDLSPPPEPMHHAMAPVVPVTAMPVDVMPVDLGSESAVPGTKYTVKKGDTLWSIAQRTYGNGQQYRRIVAANPSIKGDRLLAGQTIVLP